MLRDGEFITQYYVVPVPMKWLYRVVSDNRCQVFGDVKHHKIVWKWIYVNLSNEDLVRIPNIRSVTSLYVVLRGVPLL